jgi:hypothetical protein
MNVRISFPFPYAAYLGATMYLGMVVIVLMLVSEAEARELPSEVDLRAAYCFPVVEHLVRMAKTSMADDPALREQILAEVSENLRRLRLYLLPRLPHLEMLGLAAARRRGQEDVVKFEAYHQTCDSKCNPLRYKPSWIDCTKKCSADDPFAPRLKTCSDLSWLPY